ncbi:murein L,D-transpeptidase catalytic domain-containing protein [Flavobacterium pedocola]
MKKAVVILGFVASLLVIVACIPNNEKEPAKLVALNEPKNEVSISHLKRKSEEAKKFCEAKKLNTDFYFLIDLKKHSGLKRFYVWDFKKDTITNAFMVSHGCGNNPWGRDYSKENPEISNTNGSHASSVGKYVIGKRGYSNWGINVNYLLHGKDLTNSNAQQRQIVLHSWEEVTDEEIYPAGTAEGWGCPAVSNASMKVIDEMLKMSNKNVLMWVIK